MKKTVAILLAVLLLLGALAACGGANNAGNGGGSAEAEGTYVMKSFMGMDVASYASLAGVSEEEASELFKVVLKSGGKASFASDGDENDLSWSQNGDKITLSGGGENMELTLKGNELTMNVEGVEVVLQKK